MLDRAPCCETGESRKFRTCSAIFLVAMLVGCENGSVKAGEDASQTEDVRVKSVEGSSSGRPKRALIVAISDYEHWESVNAANDVPLIAGALKAQGFESVEVLRDEEATKEGIEEAFRRQLLAPARPGGIYVFHYSGHGQQITDDGIDELDGYDEALVPHDAPSSLEGDYRGERHLRDDLMHDLVQQLRRKAGPEGHVITVLDTCFSGSFRGRRSIARGGFVDRITMRGGPPLGEPKTRKTSGEVGGGFVETSTVARGALERESSPRASYIVLSAARHNQLAYETTGDDGRPVGSLTYALTRALHELDATATYRLLTERIRWIVVRRVENEPQVEGDIDMTIFGGELKEQRPFLHVGQVLPGSSELQLPAGTVMGLLAGSHVELHPQGTLEPTAASLLVKGMVVESAAVQATVRLERPSGETMIQQSWAFITDYAYPALRIRVRLAGLDPRQEHILRQLIGKEVNAVELVKGEAELIVFPTRPVGSTETHLTIETVQDGREILPPVAVSTLHWEERIALRLEDYARNRYLAGIRVADDDFEIAFEMVPIAVEGCTAERPSPDTCAITRLSPKKPEVASRWEVGEWFEIQVENRSSHDAFITLLDLMPDGRIDMLWPGPETGDMTQLAAGDTKVLDALYRITQPVGTEVILLIASQVHLNFLPFLSQDRLQDSRSLPRGGMGPFGQLFDDKAVRSRSEVFFSRADSLCTEVKTIQVTHDEARSLQLYPRSPGTTP